MQLYKAGYAGAVTFFILNLMLFSTLDGSPSSQSNDNDTKKDVIVFVVLSQPNSFHAKLAEHKKEDIIKQAEALKLPSQPVVYLTHEEWTGFPGDWAIIPLLDRLLERHKNDTLWLFFGEDVTRVDLQLLIKLLDTYDPFQEVMLGHALRDKEATIIHHFAFFENPSSFAYPDFAAGLVMSIPLAKKVVHLTQLHGDFDFSIDAKHELAKLIWNEGKGVALQHTDDFCLSNWRKGCVTWIDRNSHHDCVTPVSDDDIVFAVKTCSKFRKDRIPVMKQTWVPQAKHIRFYSDEDDPSIPTVHLNVVNTERGHCAKTMAIIRHIYDTEGSKRKWVVIVDDDTLLSIPRVLSLLRCYNSSEDVALGERYGFRVLENNGYNYITGGGGMVFSMTCIEKIVHSLPTRCFCHNIDSPDDMMLGICLKRLGISVTHSSAFHQARPNDYAKEYLEHQKPISFHKYWMIDPVQVYKEWLKDSEAEAGHQHHSEL